MSKVFTIEEDGRQDVKIGGVTVPVDVYRVRNLILDIDLRVGEEFPGDANVARRQIEYLDRVCALLADLGFGAVSHWAADKFDEALAEAADELGKTPASAPTPG